MRIGLDLFNQKGEGLFEMVLFMPLAFLLLFVGIDVGLSQLDYALVTDAIREGMHNQGLESRGVYKVVSGVLILDENEVVHTANIIADRIAENITNKRLSLGSEEGKDQAKVSVTPIVFEIDPATGTVLNYKASSEVYSKLGNPNLDLTSRVNAVRRSSNDDFISSQIKVEQDRGRFAIIKPSFGLAQNQSENRFLDSAMAYLISVEVVSPSINPSWLQANLGGELGYQIQELQIVRN